MTGVLLRVCEMSFLVPAGRKYGADGRSRCQRVRRISSLSFESLGEDNRRSARFLRRNCARRQRRERQVKSRYWTPRNPFYFDGAAPRGSRGECRFLRSIELQTFHGKLETDGRTISRYEPLRGSSISTKARDRTDRIPTAQVDRSIPRKNPCENAS